MLNLSVISPFSSPNFTTTKKKGKKFVSPTKLGLGLGSGLGLELGLELGLGLESGSGVR